MPRRPKGSLPSYRLHKQSGKAIVSLPLGDGRYRDVLLGPHGSPASHQEYARVVEEWQDNGGRQSMAHVARDLSVRELVLRFWDEHVEPHYRDPDGLPTSEVGCFRAAMRPLLALYGETPAAAFGPLSLKAVCARLVEGGAVRRVANQHLGRVRRCFAWAVAEELLPATALHALQAVKGVRKGRGQARETEPVRPVASAVVAATLPFLGPTVRAMVELQLLTGMRPGEVCRVRPCDLDVSGPVWLYRPARHKTQHLGRDRVVPIGPKAQEVLRPFLTLDTQAYLFSPARAEGDRQAARRAARKSKVYPSEVGRKRGRKRRRSSERYVSRQYAQAVERACDKAFPPPADLARGRASGGRGREHWETPTEWMKRLGPEKWAEVMEWRRGHRWHPNQLRHNHATEVRRRYGLEAAQVVLGHSKADVTQLYAERDLTLAERVAREIG